MTRAEYARYVLIRLAESVAVALGAAFLDDRLQRIGIVRPLGGTAFRPANFLNLGAARFVASLAWWAWPAAWAAVAHVLLGPKQQRPVYLRIPGAMYVYAGVRIDRNAGCRGGCTTGATGSGKTLCCILPRLHSLCINESGIERRDWQGSPEKRAFDRKRAAHRGVADAADAEIERLGANRRDGIPGKAPGTDPADEGIGLQRHQRELSAQGLQSASDPVRRMRYRVPPWGGFVCGEKGNEWQAIEALLRRYGREEDLCLIRTRPSWAPRGWTPPVRYNLIAMEDIPADTCAKILVDTGLAVEEAATRDEFFIPQARDKIAWGIRLVRAVRAATRACQDSPVPGGEFSLLTLFEILTVPEAYRSYLVRCCGEVPGLAASEAFAEARYQLENNYWNQPVEQLGGIRSTLYNFLAPFSEPEIAEVFCADSTFDLRDIQLGKVVCLAIPQKFAVQRRYVATFLKTMVYQIILERFDRRADHPDWLNRNVILVEQDEWQRNAVRADCEVDVVREALGAVYAATQSQNSVWMKLGGRDKAVPMIANLRNRWVCQSATEECAEESSSLLSGRVAREASYSHGAGGRTTTVSFPERPLLPRRELRTLPPFHVIFAPAEGRWLYRKCIAMPATPDGRIPDWWFGDWNPLHWAAHLLGLPARIGAVRLHPGNVYVPPWRANAPVRAQVRRLFGFDGTFIILGGVRANSTSG